MNFGFVCYHDSEDAQKALEYYRDLRTAEDDKENSS